MIKIFVDTADFEAIKEAAKNPLVKGFTTNPTLLKKAGVTDYADFAIQVTDYLTINRPDTCISFEVFADTLVEMERQAITIDNMFIENKYPVYIKIPVTNTQGQSTHSVINSLNTLKIKVNVTAVFTVFQIKDIIKALDPNVSNIISVFAGRIHDTGRNAVNIINDIYDTINEYCPNPHNIEILWASPRQVYDYKLARESKADIITMTPELIGKLGLLGKGLEEYSLDTVKMFYEDGQKSGLTI